VEDADTHAELIEAIRKLSDVLLAAVEGIGSVNRTPGGPADVPRASGPGRRP
jgi:hypothetical protein